jgi:hypothetical protein
MDDQLLFERAVALGLRAAKIVLERGEGISGIDRLIWQTEHPPRLDNLPRSTLSKD